MEYEALIKITDNVNDSLSEERQRRGLWKAGDIVAIKQKGIVWGRLEVKQFLIVNLGEMTEEQAKVLSQPILVETERSLAKRENEEVVEECDDTIADMMVSREIVRRARYKIDIPRLLASLSFADKAKVLDLECEFQPFKDAVLSTEYLEDKREKPDVIVDCNKIIDDVVSEGGRVRW